jgi:NAD(P)-dependent dehydrogenase (short-subunit alcohol dehydrogenase family)
MEMTGLRSFDGSVAIITGGASGIGRALGEVLAKRRCHVVLADLDGADAEAVAARLRAQGGSASARQIDVSDAAAMFALVQDTMQSHGRLDYFFNNAGIGVAGEVADYTIESWERIIAVNLGGVVNGVQAAYAAMLQQGFGHIINTASVAGLLTLPGMTSYATTKHAVVGLSKALRIEAAARGIRVSVLCPGVIRTPIISGGKHGIFLLPIPEAQQRALGEQLFGLLRPMEVTPFAEKVLTQVARNQAIIIVPIWYRLWWWIDRWCPTFGAFLAKKMFERYRSFVSVRR